MIELEFYIKKLQALETLGDWKDIYVHIFQKIHPMIYDSHFLRRNYYLKELEKYHNELIDMPFALNSGEKLKFRKLQKHIIDLLYQVQEENKKIFIIQGNNSNLSDKLTAFLGKLRLDYVILENEDQWRKVKQFKQAVKECSYAIVLFTDDDLGRSSAPGSVEKVRAAQKVIFQFGYLLSHVGRKNMVILHSEDKEIDSPFDFDDLVYAPFDSKGLWKNALVKAMENAGIYVEKSLVPPAGSLS